MMSNVTFITGLPRSRTAWLGTYAMAHGAIVVHEPLRFCPPEHLEDVFSVVEVMVSAMDKFEEDPGLLIDSQQHLDSATMDGAMFVDYDTLDDLEVMQQVHEYIVPHSPFSLRKFLTLTDLLIEPHAYKYATKTRNAKEFLD
jgi:hypothetical protein